MVSVPSTVMSPWTAPLVLLLLVLLLCAAHLRWSRPASTGKEEKKVMQGK